VAAGERFTSLNDEAGDHVWLCSSLVLVCAISKGQRFFDLIQIPVWSSFFKGDN
jgi:hypothetical protein